MKIVIIGISAGMGAASARLRRISERARIVLILRDGEVDGDFAGFVDLYNLEIRQNCQIVEIDRDGRRVLLRHNETGVDFDEEYDALISDSASGIGEMAGDEREAAIWRQWDNDIGGIFRAAQKQGGGEIVTNIITPKSRPAPRPAMPGHHQLGMEPPARAADRSRGWAATDISALEGRRLAEHLAGENDGQIAPIVDYRRINLGNHRAAAIGFSCAALESRAVDYIYSALADDFGFCKLIYSPAGKILGACAYGLDCFATMDILAAVLKSGANPAELELSRPNHPAIILGKIAQNVAAGRLHMAYWDEIDNLDPTNTLIIDTRPANAPDTDIPNTIRIPTPAIRENLYRIPTNKQILLFCENGKASYFAARILSGNNLTPVRHLTGGLSYRKFLRNP